MQIIKGHETNGYGESSIKVCSPQGDSDNYTIILCCQNKQLGKIILRDMEKTANVLKALGDDFRIVPPRWSVKWAKGNK